MPLTLTVCMPVYNSASYLAQAVESVLAQSFTDFELLIVDDCSTDGSYEIAAAFAQKDSRISLIRNDQNRGMVANWNYCLELSRGKYIRYLFGDDYLIDHNTFARQIDVLEKYPQVSLVSSTRLTVNAKGEKLELWQGFRHLEFQTAQEVVQACLELYYIKDGKLKFGCVKNLIGEPSAVMFRRSQAMRGFNPDYRQFVDLEMWFYLLRQGDFSYIADPLIAFRRHEAQQTVVNTRDLVHLWEYLSLIKQNVRFAYPYILAPFDRYVLMYECYRIFNLNKRDGLFTQEATEASVSGVISPAEYRLQLPLFLLLLPFYKIISKLAGKWLTGYRRILPDVPLA